MCRKVEGLVLTDSAFLIQLDWNSLTIVEESSSSSEDVSGQLVAVSFRGQHPIAVPLTNASSYKYLKKSLEKNDAPSTLFWINAFTTEHQSKRKKNICQTDSRIY